MTVKREILELAIRSPLGITCDETEIRLKRSHQTVSAAISEMVKKGMIMPSGEYRSTRTGNKAKIYVRRLGMTVRPKKRRKTL